MPRVARIVIPGMPHHVTQRGNNRQDVFFVDDDRRVYLELLKKQSVAHGLKVVGYCLMTNHVHLVAVPREEQSLARAVGRTHFLYTQYVNRMHRRSGHLWQNRFYSCSLDEVHLWRALAYVERNPVRARRVRLAWRWAWSSAALHCGEPEQSGVRELVDSREFREEWKAAKWQAELREPEDGELVARIRLSTHTGRPLATDRLLARLETRLGRRLRPLPVGRPSKKKSTAKK
jgi:putative transposase